MGMPARGFTYLAVLFVVAVMGAALASTATVWRTVSQREKEQELLFIGHEFRRALLQYHERSPGGAKQYPKRLEDLLEDRRFPTLTRHLRRIYRDPMTGSQEWGLVVGPDGMIVGVYSLSMDRPLKTGNFDPEDKAFEAAASYQDWKFVAAAPVADTLAVPGSPGTAASMPAANAAVPAPGGAPLP